MSVLSKLDISNLRNITKAKIRPASTLNLFYGENGSGKSSILEAIYLLGMARSFRGNAHNPLIQYEQNECAVFCELSDGQSLGLSRPRRGGQQIKVSGSTTCNAADLARCLPILLLNSDTFKLLEGSPKVRRHYLDWGAFHVEHRFIEQWRQVQRALKNRNLLLKNMANKSEIDPWTVEFVKHAKLIDQYRDSYLKDLLPVVSEILKLFLPIGGISLEYYRGWDEGVDLQELLDQQLTRDLKYGYTVPGPQRADLKIKIGKHASVDILSRGQQKMLVSTLKIAQGALLENKLNKKCVYLVDDLPSELDRENRLKVCSLLAGLNSQVFITSVEKEDLNLDDSWGAAELDANEKKLFHVKHGKINQESNVH